MDRRITGFHRDEASDWVADLDCGHARHVRHDPPWRERPWVASAEGRAARIGTRLDCARCDRLELPEGYAPYRRTATFDADRLPAGLRARHTAKRGVWGRLHVLEGRVAYRLHPPLERTLVIEAGGCAAIPPEVAHEVEPLGDARLYVEFHRRASTANSA